MKKTFYQLRLKLPKSLRKMYVKNLRNENRMYKEGLDGSEFLRYAFAWDSAHEPRCFWSRIQICLTMGIEVPEIIPGESYTDYSNRLTELINNKINNKCPTP